MWCQVGTPENLAVKNAEDVSSIAARATPNLDPDAKAAQGTTKAPPTGRAAFQGGNPREARSEQRSAPPMVSSILPMNSPPKRRRFNHARRCWTGHSEPPWSEDDSRNALTTGKNGAGGGSRTRTPVRTRDSKKVPGPTHDHAQQHETTSN